MENDRLYELEHKIVNLEARLRFYELIICKLEREEELSYGQLTTVIQLLVKYNKIKIPRKNKGRIEENGNDK